jgi:hypothetical protein
MRSEKYFQILTSSFQWKNNIPTQFYDWRGFETLNQTLTYFGATLFEGYLIKSH